MILMIEKVPERYILARGFHGYMNKEYANIGEFFADTLCLVFQEAYIKSHLPIIIASPG